MNKIYKVIWSKAKHTYVVASEIAKGHTKGETTGKGLKRLAAALLVAAALMGPNFAWAADTTTVTDTSTTQQTMYTKDGADNTFATKGSLTTEAASREAADTKEAGIREAADTKEAAAREAADTTEAADRAAADTTLQSNIDKEATARETADTKLQTAVDAKANAADVYSKTDTDTKLADKANAADVYSKTDTDTKLADKANVADVYSKADADTTFATKTEVSKADTDLQKSIDEEARKRKYSVTNLEKADANEAAAREAADTQLDSRTSAVETKTASLTRVAAANSTSINESMTYKGNQYSATLQVNGSGAQIGVVNKEAAGLANDGGTAYTEYRARTGAIVSKATNDISSTSSNGQIIDTAGDTAGEYSQAATAKSTGTTFTYNDGTSSSSTTIKGNAISTGSIDATGNISAASVVDNTLTSGNYVTAGNTVGENIVALDTQAKANADAIDEEARKRKYSVTNLENADKQLQANIDKEAAAREAGDKALDDRITNVKEYLENQTSENYVSKADAAVQDGAVVKAANTIGENVTNLDAALAKETAARLGADKAQDKVIQQVNDNLVQSVNTINKNVADGFNALNAADANEAKARADADAAEKAARIDADAKLAGAVNSSISLSDENVLQKNTTSVDADGNVTTGKADVTEMILNKGGDHQITLSENGIKVGLNSGVMDKDGFYAGGDTAEAAKAALKANGSIKGADGDFTVDGTTGNVSTKGSLTAASGTIGNVSMSADGTVTGVKDLTASGKVTAGSFTDGTATMSNGSLNGVNQINATGNIVTTSNMQAHDMTATGTITGQNINGTTGTFGSLSTTGNASVGGTLTTNGITNTGNATTDTLTVNHNATVGGNLGVTGDITGKSLNVGTGDIKGGQITGTGLDVGAGTIKTAGAVETGTLKTTGNTEIGGNLDVKGNLAVEGEFNSKTLSSKLDENNYTTINGGNVTSKNMKLSDVNGRTYTSTSKFNEEGRTDTAADGTTTNVSVMTAGGSDSTISSLADENQKSYITQNLKNILQGIKNGTNESSINQTETGIKSTATDGKNTASTNLSNKGFNTYANDGTNRTYTLQTAESLTSQIGDDGKVKSVMNADGITNNADGGTITNSAKDLVNTATGNMTNTVGGRLLNDVTGDMENKVGRNLTTTVSGTSTETVTGKKTENYNGGLETTVTGEEKHTVNGSQTNAITGDQTNTIGGSQTTTVTGDSSLTAENINNTATNKITNKALDVETEAKSSIMNKVSNDYGSNTSTQLSYETKEEMSANGKTASYLRGAAEEKSQLTDGAKKTTIDTVAGQTNTNITDGTNISNSLQKADQAASSVTDGTNTTVVNQDAKSLASSITDGAKANNTSSTVDASVQRIQTDDTHYSVSSKSASKMEDALFNGSTVIDSLKDAEKGLVSTAVTDGTNLTGSSMTAKGITSSAAESIVNEIGDGSAVKSEMTANGITNTAKDGTITNDAKDLVNTASNSITDKVGENVERTMTTEKIQDKVGKTTVTTTDGLTKLTNEGGTHKTEMDFADVLKDLGVRGNATVDKKLTVKGDSDLQGSATVGKDLEVKGSTKLDGTLEVVGKSTFKDDVTMEKNLDVKGITTTDKLVVNNGATVAGGTTTDTLHVTSTATFDDIVTMKKDLSVGGNVDAASYTVKDTGIKIDKNGINAGGTKVTGLAPADISHAGSTDAVSGGQLYETNTRVSGLETRMGTVETRVDKLDNKIDKVGANAAAMANLHPLEFDEDSKWNVAAAVGSSGSETASAVGVFYRPNENVMVNASAAMGTGENMFGGGVSLRLGHGGNKAKEAQMKAAAAENKELRAKVDDLTARMDALLSVLNPNMSKDFPDVPENHWAYEAVSRLAGNGIVEGYEDGKYHGERQMTRYEMAEIIYNALSKGAKAEKKLVEEFRPELQAMAVQKKA